MNRLFAFLLVLLLTVGFGGAAMAQDDMTFTVTLGGNDDLDTFFVDGEGMTLYLFTNDEPGVSNCTGGCLENWPPLTVADGEIPALDPAISGLLGFLTMEDGSRHVTYNGMPLYYWVNDEAPGDATGHEVGDVWFVVTMPYVGLGGNDELGEFLVGENGFTLYTFANDEPGVSNCVDNCAANWPPLTVVGEEELTVQPGLAGEFSLIERTDGTLQVTLNDEPLYFWVNDSQPGDSTGHLVGDVWFAATLPTMVVAESEEFGEILVGANGMTLYTFANDEAGVSNCVDGCAANWPPLTIAEGAEAVAGEGIEGEIAAIERADGTLQITYNGEPLYYWVRDVIPGDTTGHNVGDVWFVALP
ncbi:MAG: hypothetical protein GYB67_18905 [Chloroflexi bacterium]|nr:hypothetical protein [Chloroflexota bacterium]